MKPRRMTSKGRCGVIEHALVVLRCILYCFPGHSIILVNKGSTHPVKFLDCARSSGALDSLNPPCEESVVLLSTGKWCLCCAEALECERDVQWAKVRLVVVGIVKVSTTCCNYLPPLSSGV